MEDASKPQTDREWLMQIDNKLDTLTAAVTACQSNCGTQRKAAGDRLTALENFRYVLVGISICLGIAIPLVGPWFISKFVEGH